MKNEKKCTCRSPYEWDRVGEDTPNKNVVNLLNALREVGHKIIIFTGRDGECRDVTLQWLEEKNIEFSHFDMREAGDKRCDSIVKQEMFNRVKDDYNILGVFDDRDQVVEMWRDLGLQCFQVNYGNF